MLLLHNDKIPNKEKKCLSQIKMRLLDIMVCICYKNDTYQEHLAMTHISMSSLQWLNNDTPVNE